MQNTYSDISSIPPSSPTCHYFSIFIKFGFCSDPLPPIWSMSLNIPFFILKASLSEPIRISDSIHDSFHDSFHDRIRIESTGCLDQLGHRNGAVVSLFWDFWGPKGLLCYPKTGRKLLLGQKFTNINLKNC